MTPEEWDAYAAEFGEEAANQYLGPRPGESTQPQSGVTSEQQAASLHGADAPVGRQYSSSESSPPTPDGWTYDTGDPSTASFRYSDFGGHRIIQRVSTDILGQKAWVDVSTGAVPSVHVSTTNTGTEAVIYDQNGNAFTRNTRTGALEPMPANFNKAPPAPDLPKLVDMLIGGTMHQAVVDANYNVLHDLGPTKVGAAAPHRSIENIGGRAVLVDLDTGRKFDLGPSGSPAKVAPLAAPEIKEGAGGIAWQWDGTKWIQAPQFNTGPGAGLAGPGPARPTMGPGGASPVNSSPSGPIFGIQQHPETAAEAAHRVELANQYNVGLEQYKAELNNPFSDRYGAQMGALMGLYGQANRGAAGSAGSNNPFWDPVTGTQAQQFYQQNQGVLSTAQNEVLSRQLQRAQDPANAAQAAATAAHQAALQQQQTELQRSINGPPQVMMGGGVFPFGFQSQSSTPAPLPTGTPNPFSPAPATPTPATPPPVVGLNPQPQKPLVPMAQGGAVFAPPGQPVTISAGGQPVASAGEPGAGPEVVTQPAPNMAQVTPMGPSNPFPAPMPNPTPPSILQMVLQAAGRRVKFHAPAMVGG